MAKKMDRKLVAKSQRWEVSYLARKFGATIANTLRTIMRLGRSRKKVNEALRRRSKQRRRR